jgi:hypothetical protein
MQVQHFVAPFHDNRRTNMKFLINLFRNKAMMRSSIRRYVDIEYRSNEREAEYVRLIIEAGL